MSAMRLPHSAKNTRSSNNPDLIELSTYIISAVCAVIHTVYTAVSVIGQKGANLTWKNVKKNSASL